MVSKEDILKTGKAIYQQWDDTSGRAYANYADENSNAAPAYILAEERFISGHDDTALFVEIIDTDGKTVKRWTFSEHITVFQEPWLCADDCLILYLVETFKIPVKRGCGFEGKTVEELF